MMNDLISREAVIKAMENNSFMVEVFGTKRKMIDGMMMCCEIADLPTIEAVPVVHGEWIEVGVTCGITILKCSNCGKEHPRLHEDFCRDCGADMRKGCKE